MAPKYDTDSAAFRAMSVLALCVLAPSLVSAAWTISSIVRRGRYNGIGDSLPLYLAICDVGFSVCHSIDHTYVLATNEFPPRRLCSALGALLQLWLGSGITMAAVAAVTVYVRVYRGREVNWGRGEWGFLALAFGLNVACVVAGLAVGDVFGPAKFWCYIDAGTREGVICNVVFNTVPVATAFVACAFCYGMVWRKITKHSRRMRDAAAAGPSSSAPDKPRKAAAGATPEARGPDDDDDDDNDAGTRGIAKTASLTGGGAPPDAGAVRARRNRPVVKMMACLAGYFVRWFVAVVLALATLTGNHDSTFLYVGTIATVNAGGVIHAVGYWCSTGPDERPARSPSTTPSRKGGSVLSHPISVNPHGTVDGRCGGR